MTKKNNIVKAIQVWRKRTTPQDNSFYERSLNVQGDNLMEIKKLFDEIDNKITNEENKESKKYARR